MGQETSLTSMYTLCATQYSGRQLTKERDALDAFAGISDQISSYYRTPVIFGLPLKILLQSLMWVFDYPVETRMLRRTFLKSTGFNRFRSVSSPLLPSWCWAAYSHCICFASRENWLTRGAGFSPGSELKVLADIVNVSLTVKQRSAKIHANFCSDPGKSPLRKISTILDGFVPCISRLAKLSISDFTLDGDVKREWPLPHFLLGEGAIGWMSLSAPLRDLSAELHCLQLFTSKCPINSHILICHIMLVDLYEQDKSKVKMGSEGKSFEDVFLEGSDWAKFTQIHDMEPDQARHANHFDKGPHPDFLRGRHVVPPRRPSWLEREEISSSLSNTLLNVRERQDPNNSTKKSSCAECERLTTMGTRFGTAGPNQKDDIRLYLARRLGIGQIILDAWEAAEPVTAAILLG